MIKQLQTNEILSHKDRNEQITTQCVSLRDSDGNLIPVDIKPQLTDKQGNKTQWAIKKQGNAQLAASYTRINEKTNRKYPSKSVIDRVINCAGYLIYNYSITTKKTNLKQVYLCKNRFCPVCQSRIARRQGFEANQVLSTYAKQNPGTRYLMMTLTIKNCPYNQLGSRLDLLNKAFYKFRRRRIYTDNFTGAIKVIEITTNRTNKEFHPHLHIILSTKEAYFSKSNSSYITSTDLSSAWAEIINQEMAVVDIRAIYNKTKSGDKVVVDSSQANYSDAVKEVTKYVTKSEDYLIYTESPGGKLKINPDETDEILSHLYKHTFKRRLISYIGDLGRVKKQLFGDKSDEEFTNEELLGDELVEAIDEDSLELVYAYNYHLGDYLLDAINKATKYYRE